MKITAKIRLYPDDEQSQLLRATLQRANAACDAISAVAWEKRTLNRNALHHLCYYSVREQFGLGSQVAVRALGKVADSYKLDRKTRRHFAQCGAFPYDSRLLSFNLAAQTINIWTLEGRQTIAYRAGERQHQQLAYQQGESKLLFKRGKFYLLVTCDIPEADPIDTTDYMGVDLGIANIATTSDGKRYTGKTVNRVRHRNQRLRSKLQRKGTKSAKRRLKHRAGKEQRFANDVNHCIATQIVNTAKGTGRGLALEDLKGIRRRARLRKSQRTQLHSRAFHDLQQKILYKAQLAGVPVMVVNPAYTSQTCAECGCIDKRNRKTQDHFLCVGCGFSAHADHNAAVNIGRRASVNTPNAVTAGQSTASHLL